MADQKLRVHVVNERTGQSGWAQLEIPELDSALTKDAFERYWKPAIMAAYLNADRAVVTKVDLVGQPRDPDEWQMPEPRQPL